MEIPTLHNPYKDLSLSNEQDQPGETTLKSMSELFSEGFLKKVGRGVKGPEKIAELERVLTEEGLRDLARTRTTYMLNYMSDPKKYQKGDWYIFPELLRPQVGETVVVDAATFWYTIDDERKRIALDEIGTVTGTDINKTTQWFKEKQESDPDSVTAVVGLPTNNPLFDVQIIWKKGEGMKYQFFKKAE